MRSDLLTILVLATSACGDGKERLPARGIVVVTLDTTRADRLGCYGYASAATPVVDGLASRGLRFANAYTPTPITLPSHASLLTGAYPCAHGVRDNAIAELGPDALLISEVFRERGWRTAGFVGSVILDQRYGTGQGFEVYGGPSVEGAGFRAEVLERPANEVVDEALQWLQSVGPEEQFFLWVHLYDPHAPYAPPDPRPGADNYDGEIAFCDQQIGRLLEGLEGTTSAGAAAENAGVWLVVTADHGESLGDHGEETHGMFLYEAAMRIPLIVVPPRSEELPAATISHPVSLTDVVPTLLDAAGIAPQTMQHAKGISLLRQVRDPPEDRALYLESFMPYYAHRWHPQQGVVDADYKWIRSSLPELFHLGEDPGELHDLSLERKQEALRLEQSLDGLLSRHASLGWQIDRLPDSLEREQLEALGYVTGSHGGEDPPATLPDPKLRVADLARYDEARNLVRQGSMLRQAPNPTQREQGEQAFARARGLLAELRENNPGDVTVDQILGMLEVLSGNHAAAVAPLERLLVRDPTLSGSRYNLMLSYERTGHPDWAYLEALKLLSLEPRFVRAHQWLVARLSARGELGEAVYWLTAMHDVLRETGAPVADTNRVLQELRSLRQRMQQAGQQPVTPTGFPVVETAPEGVLGR